MGNAQFTSKQAFFRLTSRLRVLSVRADGTSRLKGGSVQREGSLKYEAVAEVFPKGE